MTTSADQVRLFNRLIFQELLEMRRITQFCSDGLREIMADLHIEWLDMNHHSGTRSAVVVTALLPVEDDTHLRRLLDDGLPDAELLDLRNIEVRAPSPQVTLTDIDHASPAIIARKRTVRSYALRRLGAADIDESVGLIDINRCLATLDIEPLALKRFTYLVPVSGKISYQVLAEEEAQALVHAKAFVHEDREQGYLERGELYGPGDVMPDTASVFELSEVSELPGL